MPLSDYQKLIIAGIQEHVGLLGPKTALRDACEYALMNGGKRLRPAISLMVAKALNKGQDVTPIALAIEFFHTASLVADDLPCMDDDDERRSKPSVHKVYGEAMALLVSYALIAAGYGCYAQNAALLKKTSNQSDLLCTLALENAAFNTGLWGATGGQFMDLAPPDLTLPTLRNVIHKKTTSLFEIAFVSGWLFGGGALNSLETVKRVASHFGMAFQIADDLDDLEKDRANGRLVNMAAVFGPEAAKNMVEEELHGYRISLEEIGLIDPELFSLADALEQSLVHSSL